MEDEELFARRGITDKPFKIKELVNEYIVSFEEKAVYELRKAGRGQYKRYIVEGLYESLRNGAWTIEGENKC